MTAAVRTSSVAEGNRQPVPGVKNVIAVGAGKGGVGKTTVAVNLAVALAQMGSRVAMIDGDIYGPNVPIDARPRHAARRRRRRGGSSRPRRSASRSCRWAS